MPDMTSAGIEEYLAEARIADLVTLREDGSPMWRRSGTGTGRESSVPWRTTPP